MKDNYINILKECIKIAEERQGQYGEAITGLQKCSDILKTSYKIDLDVGQICDVLIALKLSRQFGIYKEDNLFDMINYTAIKLFYKKLCDDSSK